MVILKTNNSYEFNDFLENISFSNLRSALWRLIFMTNCLFCSSSGPFSTIEHIIPESLGNDTDLLRDIVCDSCQSYFGKEVEKFVLEKTPIAFWRTFLGIKTKKGNYPSVDLSQPQKDKGKFPSVHPMHDDIGFTYYEDRSISVDIDNPNTVKNIYDGNKDKFLVVINPEILYMLGRFFCKIGIELLSLEDSNLARSKGFEKARRYARFGEFDGLWPIFHFSKGNLSDLKELKKDDTGYVEEVQCYSYSLVICQNIYWLLLFSIGTDNWLISLNEPFPKPIIQEAFPNDKLKLIWYSSDAIKRKGNRDS